MKLERTGPASGTSSPPAEEQVSPSVNKLEITSQRPPRRPHILRRLYEWVLQWADTPYGTPALFCLAVAESSFFPVPPDVLQIALSVSKPKRSFFYAAVSGFGSVLGGVLGYVIGLLLWAAVGGFFMKYVPGLSQENIDYVGRLYQENAFWAIVCAGFTPIPYKVFTIAAGIFHEYVSLGVLIGASVIGRFGRFLLVGACLYFLGPGVKLFLERYFDWAALALAALAVLGFVAVKWLM